MDKLLSVGQVARRLRVSVDVVRSLDERGELKGRRTPGGHRRYLPADVDRVIARQRAGRTKTQTRPSRSSAPRRTPPAVHDRAAAADAEHQRLEALKKYGRDLAVWLPTEWQARVIEDLEDSVTSKHVPPSLAPWQAQRIVQSRVDAIKKQYNDAEDQRRKRDDDQRKVDWLIAWGKSYAVSETSTGWDSSGQDRARREVESELKQKRQRRHVVRPRKGPRGRHLEALGGGHRGR